METADDVRALVLARVLDDEGVPLHVRFGNQRLAALLTEERLDHLATSAEVAVLALRSRKLAGCPGCRGEGGHTEPDGARVEEYTPGAK